MRFRWPRASRAGAPPRSRRAGRARRCRLMKKFRTWLWARDEDEVREAQRLRYQVFADEMGARLSLPGAPPAGHDTIVRSLLRTPARARRRRRGRRARPGHRHLPRADAGCRARAGGFYSDTEFDLTRCGRGARAWSSWAVPVCTRTGARRRHPRAVGRAGRVHGPQRPDTMIGCASISMRDGGHVAASLWKQLRHTTSRRSNGRCGRACRCRSMNCAYLAPVEAPALIKGYLRCGARVLGAPAWDPDFNTADLPLLMRIADLPPKSAPLPARGRQLGLLALAELVVDQRQQRVHRRLLVVRRRSRARPRCRCRRRASSRP